PSGAERATRSLAIVLPPPTTFSITTVRPSARDMCSPTRRATVSVPPPAEYGTTIVTFLVIGCAAACEVNAASRKQALVSARLRSITSTSPIIFVRPKLRRRKARGNVAVDAGRGRREPAPNDGRTACATLVAARRLSAPPD